MAHEQVVYDPVQNGPVLQPNPGRFSRRSVLVVVGVLAIVGCIGVVALKPNSEITVHGPNGFLGLSSDGDNSCSVVTTQPGFNLATYISANWFIQQQMPIDYQEIDDLYCVEAQYTALNPPKFWGQTIQVRNRARSVQGFERDSEDLLCASQGPDAADPAKLQVGPCFLPRWQGVTSGPYWVLAYDEAAGYALVSGGQPTIQMPNGCRTGTGTNGSGLWILTRQQMRPSRADTHRRIALGGHACAQLTINPLLPAAIPQCVFIGADSVIGPFQQRMAEQAALWDVKKPLHVNLQEILGTQLPPPTAKQVEDCSVECGVCYSYMLDDTPPTQACNNQHCGQVYHLSCIVDWLQALPDCRRSFDTIFGECPYCSDVMSVSCK